MKQLFFKGLCTGTLVLLFVPVLFAQDKTDDDKGDKKETQQIIITRKNTGDQKTVIEITGDKVTINGKDGSDDKDVRVQLNRIRDMQSLSGPGAFRSYNGNYNFNYDNNTSLFAEDDNRAMLGVVTEEGDNGARISTVSKGSAAEKAGLKEGDVITKVGDTKIDNTESVAKAVRAHKPGDKVAVTISRSGKEQKLTAELGKYKGIRMNELRLPTPAIAPEVWRSLPNGDASKQQYEDALKQFRGNTFSFGPSPKLGLSVQDTDDGRGVKVLEADEDGSAAKAGIKKDDIITQVNDKEVNTTAEITRAIRDSRSKGTVRLQVLRGSKTQTIEVKIPHKLTTADL